MGGGPHLRFFYSEGRSSEESGTEQTASDIDGIVTWFSSLNAAESVCWAFDCKYSDVIKILWSHTVRDIRIKLKLKMGFITAKSTQEYQILSSIVGSALGIEKKPKAEPPKNFDQAQMMFSKVFSPK